MAAAIASAEAAALGMRLAPWHDTLTAFKSPWEDANKDLTLLEGEECILWLRIPTRPRRPVTTLLKDLGRISGALRLLELLTHLDFDAWVREMFTIWPEPLYRAWVEFKLKPVALQRPIRFGLVVTASRSADVDQCSIFLAHKMTNVSRSKQFMLSHRELLQDYEQPPSNGQWPAPICIKHNYSMQSGEINETEMLHSTEMLQSTIRIANVLASVEGQRVGPGPQFAVQELCSAALTGGVIDSVGLTLLLELARLGVRIGNLPTLSLRSQEHEDMKQIAEALRYLIAQDDASDGGTNSGLRSVTISCWHSREIMIALLSAVETSKNVREVEIDLYEEQESDDENDLDDDVEDERGGDWQWVAYHLFSRFANHNIDTLRMNLRAFRSAEVDAIRDVLKDKNPLARLGGRPDQCNDEQPQILASRFCVIFPEGVGGRADEDASVDHNSDKYMYTTPTPVNVRVISKPVEGEGPWWLVVLAGLGFAWVHEDDVLSFVPSSSEDDALTRPTFPTVIISDLGSNSNEPSVDLLTLIGQGTSRVELRACEDDTPLDEWCGSVLRACPQLEEFLLLAGMVESLEVFVAAAEAGNCRLRELKVQYPQVSTSEHVVAFFTALSEPLHPLTKHLQQLDLNFVIVGGNNLAEIVNSAVRMLEKNRRLQHVRLVFRCLEDSNTHKVTIDSAFQPQLEAKVAVRDAPLGHSSKLAFVSVQDQQLAAGGALGRLDIAVIEDIFEFAAASRVRLLQVDVPILL